MPSLSVLIFAANMDKLFIARQGDLASLLEDYRF